MNKNLAISPSTRALISITFDGSHIFRIIHPKSIGGFSRVVAVYLRFLLDHHNYHRYCTLKCYALYQPRFAPCIRLWTTWAKEDGDERNIRPINGSSWLMTRGRHRIYPTHLTNPPLSPAVGRSNINAVVGFESGKTSTGEGEQLGCVRAPGRDE